MTLILKKPVIIGKLAHKDSLIKSIEDIGKPIETLILETEGKKKILDQQLQVLSAIFKNHTGTTIQLSL